MYVGGLVIKEAEPRGEKRAVEGLDGVPDILPEDVVEGFFKVTGNKRAAS
jgi:hypothetical protein